MARKNITAPTPQERPRLAKPRAQTATLIQRQIDRGEELLRFAQTNPPDAIKAHKQTWSDYIGELLKVLFTTPEISKEFGSPWGGWDPNPSKYRDNLTTEIQDLLRQLHSILARLELFEEVHSSTAHPPAPIAGVPDQSIHHRRDVFLVHGRDEAAKQTVARFLEKLDLNPVILHEQPDKGRAIINKFEDHSDVGFAVVLLSPDDEGRLQGSADLKTRARQNVILELGFFIGRLGRDRVCTLKVDGVEEPSDLNGVLYTPFDTGGAWRLTLARELKAARIDIDMNRAL
jgi:predicted nucleotide-binding protein